MDRIRATRRHLGPVPFLALALAASAASAGIEIDLQAGADFTVWGARQNGQLGWDVEIGDLNGDGMLDFVFEEKRTSDDPQVFVTRACMVFGPHSPRGEIDLLTDPIPACVELGGMSSLELAVADLDGDGLDDLLIARSNASPSALIFRGRPAWPAILNEGDADWSFVAGPDKLYWATIGDLNGDGHPDLVLVNPTAGGPGRTRPGAGEAYLIFGPPSAWPRERILGIQPPDVIIYAAIADQQFQGHPVVQDILSDGIPDLHLFANGVPNGLLYVLRGRSVWPPVIDLLDSGAADIVVRGALNGSGVGHGIAAGDWDGDGFRDLFLSAPVFDPGGRVQAGAVLVFRGPVTSGVWDLGLTPPDGVVVGPRAGAALGTAIRLADFDGDGYEDLVAGAFGDPTPWGRAGAGAFHVLPGCDGFRPYRDLAVDGAELSAYGADSDDSMGWGVAVADVDGDGRSDLLAGNRGSASISNSRPFAGEVRLILGREMKPPVCTIAADAGPPSSVCTGVGFTLNGSATVVTGCSLPSQYRWLQGSTVVRDWSIDPLASAVTLVDATYSLEVRCGDCAGPCAGSASVPVTVVPDPLPPDQGNVLRAVRRGDDVQIQFPSAPATAWRLFADIDKLSLGTTPLAPDASVNSYDHPGVARLPPNRYYQLRGLSPCSRSEGP